MNAAIPELAAALRAGATSAVQLAEAACEHAALLDGGRAFAWIDASAARERAEAADADLAAGRDHGPLHGIAVAVKDVIDVAGMPTWCGTPGLGHRRPTADAAVVANLRQAGAVIIGKTRTHELAWGMVTPGTGNPRSPGRITGGSSGGSAAAVAAGVVPLALGTDTGGSVRNPAALCGIVGLKAAHSDMPMAGVRPLAPSQDCLGVLANTAADCATALAVMTGTPAEDAAKLPGPPSAARVGVVADPWANRLVEPVSAAVSRTRESLTAAGVECVDVEVALSEAAPAASYVTMLAESAYHWWPEAKAAPESIGRDTGRLLELGSTVPAVHYLRARAVAEAITERLRRVFTEVDALLLATCPVAAAPIGAESVEVNGRREPVDAAHARLTALASVTGLPALSVPMGADREGLPLGIQFVSDRTEKLYRLGALCTISSPGT